MIKITILQFIKLISSILDISLKLIHKALAEFISVPIILNSELICLKSAKHWINFSIHTLIS